MKFEVIDLIFAVILVFFVIRCVAYGFIREFFSKLALLGGAFCGLLFYRLIMPIFPDSLPPLVVNIASFLIVFIAVYLVIRIVEKIIGLAFKGEILGGLDRALGFFLGIFEGLLIISLILLVLNTQRIFDPQPLVQDSFFYRFLYPVINTSNQILKKSFAFF